MKKEKWIIWLLAGVNFTHILDFMVIMPLGPQLKRVFELGPTEWSLVVASYTFAAFASGLAAVFYIDKFERKRLLLLSYFGFMIGTLLCGFANSFTLLLLARAMAGIFGGVLGALVLTIMGDVVPLERRGAAMGKIMAGFSLAAAIGVPFGIWFGTRFGWEVPFFATAVLTSAIIVLIMAIFPRLTGHLDKEQKTSAFKALGMIFKDGNKVKAFAFMSLLILGQFTIIPFLSPYMVSNVGFMEEELTYIYLLGGLCTVFTSQLVGRWADKYGNGKVFIIIMFLSLVPMLWITHLGTANMVLVLVLTSMFFIFSTGRMIPAINMVLATAEPQIRGVFMSVRSSLHQLVAGLAAFLAGMIMTEAPDGTIGNYNYVGYLAVVCSLACLLLVNRIKVKY